MQAVISRVNRQLQSQLFEVDDQLKSLGELVTSVRGGKGGSVIVYGQAESGRSAVVDRALKEYGQGVDTVPFCLSHFGTETNALATLLEKEASKEPLIVVVDSADDLVCKSKQALLYRLLDRAKTAPWLVLLIITNQDMISSLEKRVRSRLPAARVFLGEAVGEAEWPRLFDSLLEGDKEEEKNEVKEEKPATAKKSKRGGKKGKDEEEKENEGQGKQMASSLSAEERQWSAFVRRFLADPEVARERQRLYKYSGHLATVKKTLSLWLVLLEADDVEKAVNADVSDEESARAAFRRTVDEFTRAVEMVVPVRDEVAMAVGDLPHRAFCVLAAAARRLRCNPTGTFAYGKIAVDFLHQCNNVDRRMLPDGELQTYKELDRLCELGILAAVGSATHAHSFRQVVLNCPLPVLLSNVRAACTSAALREWFESQPVN